MRDVPVRKTCPRCYGTHVVRDGYREGQQQYQCTGCGYQFIDRKEVPGHGFPAEVIATAIALHLLGRSYRKIAAYVKGLFAISDTDISERNVLSWVEKFVGFAAGQVPKPSLGRIEMGVIYLNTLATKSSIL